MTPRTLPELRDRLLSDVDPLSPRPRQVRRYVLDRPRSIALDTLAVIAAQADVPPSTLVRFARELGFDGSSALQKLYKTHLHRHYADYCHPYAQAVRELVADASGRGARVLPLTDDEYGPSTSRADCVLPVRDAATGELRSLDASLCLARALCLALACRRGERPASA